MYLFSLIEDVVYVYLQYLDEYFKPFSKYRAAQWTSWICYLQDLLRTWEEHITTLEKKKIGDEKNQVSTSQISDILKAIESFEHEAADPISRQIFLLNRPKKLTSN